MLATFRQAADQHGIPGLHPDRQRHGLHHPLRRRPRRTQPASSTSCADLGIIQKNSRPNHPTTCGKVERFQQTLKKWLLAQPDQPATIADLQALLDAFRDEYNHDRPHRSLPHRATPATAYTARPKAAPGSDRSADTHDRVRTDRIDSTGCVTLRINGRLHHIGIGRTHTGTHVLLLVQDLHVRVVDAATGELLRELVLDPARDYQPTGRPPGPAPKKHKPGPTNRGSGLCRCPETSHWRWRWDLNPRRACTLTRFRGVLLRPLGHATAGETTGPAERGRTRVAAWRTPRPAPRPSPRAGG